MPTSLLWRVGVAVVLLVAVLVVYWTQVNL
jgi:hypothetical protein